MPEFHVIIPARFDSGRLPGKPLLAIADKPMIQHVVEAAQRSAASSVTVATDDPRIVTAVTAFGGQSVMTSADHQSGSDRIAEACGLLGLAADEIVVNLQGDEPLMPAALIDQVARLLIEIPGVSMATLGTPVLNVSEFIDPSIVKVVTDQTSRALYFSRAPIPWVRQDNSAELAPRAFASAMRHLGIYAYRSGYIQQFASRSPCPLEQLERLEQLRALWHGETIACAEALETPAAGVDTIEDLQRVRKLLVASSGR